MTISEQTTASDATPITVQPASADALAFVLSTWGRRLEKKLEARPQLGFLKAFAPFQARIIRRSTVLTAMRGDRIAGFAIYEAGGPRVLHWIEVRDEERRRGVARTLMEHARLFEGPKPVITFWTSDLRHIGLADAPYTPFWLRT